MYKKALAYSLLASLLWVISCSKSDPNAQIDEGSIADNNYVSDELGWRMPIPNGWNLLSRKQVKDFESKGSDLISETAGEEIGIDGLKNLLHFQKDRFNIFQSTSQPFALEYDGEWEESNEALKQLLLQTYKNQGINAKVTETRNEMIDGVLFEAYDFTLLDPEGNVVIRQTMYSTLRNGFDFGVNLTYNSDEVRDIMLDAWRQSKFRILNNESSHATPASAPR